MMRPFLHKIKTARFSQFETVFALLTIIFLTVLLTYIRVNSGVGFAGDTGQFYMILENIHAGKGTLNQILPSENEYFFRQFLLSQDATKLCKMAWESPHFEAADYDHFKFHLYSIYYPASLCLYFFSTPYVVNGLNIFAFLLFLFIAYKISQKSEIPIFISIFTVIVISLHPAWSWSIMGQPYPDRLFLPLGLLLCYYTDDRGKLLNAMLAVLVLSALIVEKVAVYTGVFLIAYSILHYSNYRDKRAIIWRVFAGISALIFFYLVTSFFLVNPYYSGSNIPRTPAALISILSDERFFNGIKSLLWVNAPLLLPALILKPRLFLIAFVMVIPNIFGTVGGAEKTGFLTHYHTLYFPFVVYAFIKGTGEFYRRISPIKAICIFGSYIFLTASFYLLLGFDDKQNIKLTRSPTANFYATSFYNMSKNMTSYKNITNLVESNMTLNAKISTIEAGWPYLYKFQSLSIYPFDFEKVDFLFVGYEKVANQFYYYGYNGYLGSRHMRIVNDCLNSRIVRAGYDVDNPIILSLSLAILKKK